MSNDGLPPGYISVENSNNQLDRSLFYQERLFIPPPDRAEKWIDWFFRIWAILTNSFWLGFLHGFKPSARKNLIVVDVRRNGIEVFGGGIKKPINVNSAEIKESRLISKAQQVNIDMGGTESVEILLFNRPNLVVRTERAKELNEVIKGLSKAKA
jgi:hypothetical protein